MRRLPEIKPDTPEILDQTHVALRKMLIGGQISEEVYARNAISLALRWVLLGRAEDASAMVCELTPKYVREDLAVQMVLDDDFRIVAHQVAAALAERPLDMDDDDVQLALLLLERPAAKA
jgi:hypothetical protein